MSSAKCQLFWLDLSILICYCSLVRALLQSFLDTMEETGADFTNSFRSLSRLPLPGIIDHNDKKAELLTYLLEQCSTLDEQKKSCKPQMDPR